MASGSQTLTTYYAKRIIGDTAASNSSAAALLQTGTGITTATWILNQTTHNNYGIKYAPVETEDSNENTTYIDDKLQIHGGSDSTSTAWVQLRTGNTYIFGRVGIHSDPNNSYYLYVNGATYLNGATTITGVTSITNATGLDGTNNTGALIVTGGVYLNEKIKVNGTSWLVDKVGIGYDPETSGNNYQLYVNGNSRIDGCLNVFPPSSNSNYNQGIRIHPSNNWATITFCAYDNTDDTGTSANSWLIGNNTSDSINGNFYITKYGSSGSNTINFSEVDGYWRLQGSYSAVTSGSTRSILHIYGPTYGNSTDTIQSSTAGFMTYGDGGPQITFDSAAVPGSVQAGALLFTDNDSCATGASFHFLSNQNDWNVISKRFHARTGISIGTDLPTTTYPLYVNGEAYINDLLYINKNSNTITIGSQNSSCAHIYNSANIPFAFNNTILTTTGNLGTATLPWNNLYIGKANGAGIYYVGSKASYRMIRFIDNATDTYGNGISIGGGGQTIIGGGESADTAAAQVGTAGDEIMYICNDGDVNIFTTMQSGWASRKTFTFNADGFYSHSWVRTYGDTGWYSQSHGGGWYMTDNTWVRSYNSKAVYTGSGIIRSDGAVWGQKVTIQSDWLGFYSGNQAGSRYGYIQANANCMYFRKENGNNGYHFDFGGPVLVAGNIVITGGKQVDIIVNRTGGWCEWGYRFMKTDGTTRLGGMGMVGNGTTGTYVFVGLNGYNSNKNLNVYSDGTIKSVGHSTYSSRLLKTNIISLTDQEALKVLQLRPVTFDYKPEYSDKKNQIGLIAEEVETVYPAVINSQDIKGIDYSKLTPYLIKMLQMHHKEIIELRAKLEKYKNKK